MSNIEQRKKQDITKNLRDQGMPPARKTLKDVKLTSQKALNTLNFVYEHWDDYDNLTQNCLPQLDYEKAIRLTTLTRNTLEKLLDQFADVKSRGLTDIQTKELMKRANLTMRSLINHYRNVGIPFSEPAIRKAA